MSKQPHSFNPPINDLEVFRKLLHKYPELSGQEYLTAEKVVAFLSQYSPSTVIQSIGGTGVAAIYEGPTPGPTVLFRCELDALPIQERNDFSHRSVHDDVSHKCGHDGHMATIACLAALLHQYPLRKGKVILYFQPSEETGVGAIQSIDDPKFQSLKPDFVFALHNVPGYPLGTVLCKNGPFSCASKGMIITLGGKTSHAAYPEAGNSPAIPLARMIERLDALPQTPEMQQYFSLVTVIYAKMGEIAFGTAAGDAQLMVTLRTDTNVGMRALERSAVRIAQEEARTKNLTLNIEWEDEFLATFNHDEAVKLIQKATHAAGEAYSEMDVPMRWSEDFGAFTEQYTGAMFGLGSGIDCPQLHTPYYDFPDPMIEKGSQIFWRIIKLMELV